MTYKLERTIKDLESKPSLEKILVILCFSGVIFIFGSFFPTAEFYLKEQKEAYDEFWNSGAGRQMFLLGVLLVLAGIGFLFKQRWPKFVLISLFITFCLICLLNSVCNI